MPKLRREDVEDIDINALDEAEVGEDFDNYEGEIPPAGTELTGFVKKMWWARTALKDDGSGDDPMIKVLWIAGENEGDEAEFNGLAVWENLVLIPSAKFRWAPFLRVYGITLKDITTKTYVAADDDQFGAPIEKIAKFEPGDEHDEAWARIITERHRYNGEWSARPKRWLPYGEEDEPEDEPEPEDVDDEEPDDDEEYDDTEPEDDGEEADDDEPEPAPARGRGSRTKAPAATASRGSRTASKAPATRTQARTPARGTKAAAATTAPAGRSSGRAASSRTKAGASTKPAGRGRGRSAAKDDDDEPPF